MPLHPDIVEAVAKVDAARADLQVVLRRVREACPHVRVYEAGARNGLSTSYCTRVCADCGLEEQGAAYATSGDFVALKTEFVAPDSNATRHRVAYENGRPLQVRHGKYYTWSGEEQD